MECTPCIVSHCVTAPAECRTGSPGGWQKLWFLNRCEVQQFTYETVLGTARGRITGIQLSPGATVKTFGYYKRTGLQLDSTAVEENGFRWDHQALVPVVNRDAETLATLRSMVGAELVLIGLHRDGRYWLIGQGEEGAYLTNWADTKGRVAADGALMELTFALTDTHPQTELLFLDGVVAATDLDARTDLTRTWLNTNGLCEASSPVGNGPTLVYTPLGLQVPQNSQGITGMTIGIDRGSACPGTLDVDLNTTALPVGFVLSGPYNLPETQGEEFDLTMAYDTGAVAPGTYSFSVTIGSAGCGYSTVVVSFLVVAA